MERELILHGKVHLPTLELRPCLLRIAGSFAFAAVFILRLKNYKDNRKEDTRVPYTPYTPMRPIR